MSSNNPFIPLPPELTYSDIYNKAQAITDPAEAQQYLEALVERDVRQYGTDEKVARSNAESNIGYLAGYSSFEEMKRILMVFNVQHPIFGNPDAPITPEEAFKAGFKAGLEAGSSGQEQ